MISALTLIDLQEQMQGITKYTNVPLALINDHVVRISVMTEPFIWHYHPNSDEIFLGVEDFLYIDLEDRTIELGPGQLFTIPANVKHRTRPKNNRSVNLTFELAGMETVRLPGS